ncbi:hypothetical protein ACCC92_02990 [Mucilaginibacter sp. Mucisp84]|uniref:hypothetical protein n=1 Tax=Mucilaginibacter sp. Mucisp84 TaxID=3243058 RepID=UPI0039A4DFC5
MNTDTEYLKSIAEEIVASPGHNDSANKKANHHLVVEAGRLEKAITHNLNSIENFTQRDTFHFNTLSRLVNICDILYDNAGGVSADVMVLLDLMSAVRQVVPSEIRPNLKLPKAFVEIQKTSVEEKWAHHRTLMAQYKVDEKLIEIAAIPFHRFTGPPQKLCWGDFTWFKGYLAKLDIMDWDNADCASKTEALISLLIGRDFNDDRFYIYCKKYVQKRTAAVSGKRNRLLEFAECEKLVLQDTQIAMVPFDLRANTVSTRLIKWIREEIDFVETYEREQLVSKFEFKWNVETIAFFFKLLHERKVFGKIPLETFAGQIAANCSSIGREEFQATTIHSRFYMKDVEVVKALDKLMLEIRNDLAVYLH